MPDNILSLGKYLLLQRNTQYRTSLLLAHDRHLLELQILSVLFTYALADDCHLNAERDSCFMHS